MSRDAITLFNDTCFKCSELITRQYSTSFSSGIRAFHLRFRQPVYAIYGFVRYADEIVDTLHNYDKRALITRFRRDTMEAIKQQVSANPVLHAFQLVVNRYAIDTGLIDAFLGSMEKDLDQKTYDSDGYSRYIYGSAEVVGLMCLRVFTEGDETLYQKLLPYARSLGAAFQKVNFLRDVKDDLQERGRIYFPDIDFNKFSIDDKKRIEADITRDFDHALRGIKMLPQGVRLGVYIAYVYYRRLFKKICAAPPDAILHQRVRISNPLKFALYAKALMKQKLNLVR